MKDVQTAVSNTPLYAVEPPKPWRVIQLHILNVNYLCDETLYNEDGILCQCNMEFKLEDKFTSWLANNKHIWKDGKQVTMNNLHNYVIKENGKDGWERIIEGYLYTQMALFIGMKNLPLDLLCSEQFHQLAIDFITYGLEIAGDRRAEEKAHQSFNKINREKLRHIMTSEAFKHHRSILNQFLQVPFFCVSSMTQDVFTMSAFWHFGAHLHQRGKKETKNKLALLMFFQ